MSESVPVIAIPAGKCPAKLKNSDRDEVIGWCEEVLSVGRNKSITYLPSALIFFAQQFFNIFSKEYKSVVGYIEDHYGTAGNVFDVIQKVESNPILPKQTLDENGNLIKKRRGRPPKKLYSPSTDIKLQEEILERRKVSEQEKITKKIVETEKVEKELKKIKIKRK